MNIRSAVLLLVLLSLLLAACGRGEETATPSPETAMAGEGETSVAETAVTNAVTVSDQILQDNTVTIDNVTADVAGWVVIHAQADDSPGPVLGYAPVAAGENRQVVVQIDLAGATDILYAMLHVDAGTTGEYEFPGDDLPATDAGGDLLTPPFNLTIPNIVTVEDQPLTAENSVTVVTVVAARPGWLVIHADKNGSPDSMIGYAPVAAGFNAAVLVEIDPAAATETLYAMLHIDVGAAGIFEFPGEDAPATDASGIVVSPSFTVTSGLPVAILLKLAESDTLGSYLTDGAGLALYTSASDIPGASSCYDQCALAWPPLLVKEGAELTAAEGLPGALGTILRDDGTIQLTYNSWPLYHRSNDTAPGDITGHNIDNVWAVAYPETLVFLGRSDELGSFLVGPDGLSLYRFNQDQPGLSSCYGDCALAWPPLLVAAGQIPKGNAGVVGELGTIVRDDGTTQVTYAGMPLYYWVNDVAPGDVTGHALNAVWFVVPPYSLRVDSSAELGNFLVDAQGMTLYLYAIDNQSGVSSCYGDCAFAWPPLLVEPGENPVAGFGIDGELGLTTRTNGAQQVVYNGWPLYYFIDDEFPGDTTGHEINDVWFVLEP